MSTKRRGLAKGRGLDALLGHIQQEKQALTPAAAPDMPLQSIPVEQLQRGKYQPRRHIATDALEELAESIRRHGVMQPIVIRPVGDQQYEIIAGERRWRAARQAGLTHIPAIVRDMTDQVAIALALIENIQRQDLNPMEQAEALQRFHDEFGLSHQEIADTVGKARATVSNLLRLLGLDDAVKTLLAESRLDMGHARALLSLNKTQQAQIAHQVVERQLSVRQTEQLVRDLQQPARTKPTQAPGADISHLTQQLTERFGAEVRIDHQAKGKGKIVIKYHSLEELDGILSLCLDQSGRG